MTRINTNVASVRGLRNLQKANKGLNTALTRLSTGLQINSGQDNPSGLIASEKLRLQVTAIEQSISNSNRANNVIATADAALGEIGGLLNQVRGLVQEGINDGALSDAEKSANQQQIDAALTAINKIASNTSFAGDKLLDGSKSFTTSISTADAAKLDDWRINEAIIGSNTSLDVSAEITAAAEKAAVRYVGDGPSTNSTVEIGGANGNEVVFLSGSSSLADVADATNALKESTGVEARLLQGAEYTQGTASTLQLGAGANTFTFTRNETGTDATLGGDIQIEFVDADNGGGAGSALGVSVATAGTTTTITVELADDGAGTITSDLDDVIGAITGDADASALVSVALDAGAAGGTLATASAAAALTGGKDDGVLNFSDIRDDTSAGALSFEITASGNADSNVDVSVSGTTITIDAGDNATLADIVSALSGESDFTDIASVRASGDQTNVFSAVAETAFTDDASTEIIFESTDYGSAAFVDFNVLSGSFDTYTIDNTVTDTANLTYEDRDQGADVEALINGQAASGKGLNASIRSSLLDATLSFNADNNTVGSTVDISITGGGSLFQIGQDVSSAGQIGVGIEAVNTARLGGISGKLYELGSGNGKSLIDVGSGGVSGKDLVDIIDEASDRVSSLRGRLGSIQKNVIETNISTLGVALENIKEARSQITDTDFASETANLTRAQILAQAGTSVLAIANQNPQQVLSLLG